MGEINAQKSFPTPAFTKLHIILICVRERTLSAVGHTRYQRCSTAVGYPYPLALLTRG